jgi:hypothetical protein
MSKDDWKSAADKVQDLDTIIVSTGTTTEAMIPFLSEKKDLTVITNALNVAYQLTKYETSPPSYWVVFCAIVNWTCWGISPRIPWSIW